MNRQQKQVAVESLKKNFSESAASFLVSYKGLDVGQMQALRRGVRAKGGLVYVVKMRLAKRAIEGIGGAQELESMLKDQCALVFAPEPTAVAKVLYDFSREHEKLGVVAGCMESRLLSKDKVIALAKLPSREVLLAHLASTLLAPISSLARVLNAVAKKDNNEGSEAQVAASEEKSE
jgi:large subunit ribosomal protein L10